MRWLLAIGLVLNALCCGISAWRGGSIFPPLHVAMIFLCIGYLGGHFDARWSERLPTEN